MICAVLTIGGAAVSAQELEAVIKIASPTSARVEGRFSKTDVLQENANWFFLKSISAADNLAARVADFGLTDTQGKTAAIVKLADGEYLANGQAATFRYQIDLKMPANAAALAHVSWLSSERGILMLDDLLPQQSASQKPVAAKITFELPADWKIISNEERAGTNAFYVKNVEKAVFLVGKNWREQKIAIDRSSLNLVSADEWKFSESEAVQIVGEIAAEYRTLFGEMPFEKASIYLLRFPNDVKFGRWEAETRGATVTVLSGEMAFQTQSIQLLHEQLRHELFHFWMPNNLALTGNYDWFYEGFTVYQALRTGTAMNRIRFEDFLQTLEQAYNLDNLSGERVSLIAAAKQRGSGASRQVYARGMVIAFLCDAAILRDSRGRRSLSDVFREIYRRHRDPNQPEEANAAIIKVLSKYAELQPIIERYINGAEKIVWKNDLDNLGITLSEENSFVRLQVKAKPNGRQKDLLDKLGYNNWRKASGRRK